EDVRGVEDLESADVEVRKARALRERAPGRREVEAELLRAGPADDDALLRDPPRRVEAEADGDAAPGARRDRVEPAELLRPLDVDVSRAAADERLEVGVGLGRTGGHDERRR